MSRLRMAGIALTFAVGARASTPPTTLPMQAALTPAFLQPGHCYRIAFPIEGAPSYKVLELLEGGWMRAEIWTIGNIKVFWGVSITPVLSP
ncbi:MAG: hypothetical protein ACRD15_20545, partial [Vicinamibacterales bacterium]